MGFRLAPSDLTLDDPDDQGRTFDVKYVQNGKNNDVGPNADYIQWRAG